MTARVIIRTLRERGCGSVRQRGSHQIWRCGNCQSVIPLRAGDLMGIDHLTPGTLRSIKRDLEPCLGLKWLTK
jgi:predicted RNA binding protein YcfA (HicA-like mRNA interferase family)